MLRLLKTPAWIPEGAPTALVPLTVPGALIVVLAASDGWTSRERLAAIFWPDAAPPDALHHLRVNLHRARALLAGWGVDDRLQTQRHLLRLSLPTDLSHLQSDAALDGPPFDLSDWPQGWRLTGYEGFAQWCGETAQGLHAQWLLNSQRARSVPGVSVAQPPPGRDAEFQRLRSSPVPAVLLLGEPGAGKSTLLAAAFPHAPCLRGLEGLHGMPYRPLLEALRAQIPALAAALGRTASPLRPYRLDLARVLPELAPDEALPPLDALTAQTRLVEALARAFEALTPVLLVDDLQWCDPATVEWLLMLAHGRRLRWRAAVRRHEIGPALAQSLQSLRTAGLLEEIDVGPLSRTALPSVCGSRWPDAAFTPGQLDRLHTLSAGNAFALGELVAAGTGLDGGSEALPPRVLEMVQRRLHALPALAREAVEAAAIFVQPVPDSGLRALAGLDVGEAADAAWMQALGEALAAGMLRAQAPGFSCAHDLIREATAGDLSAARRMALHRHAALWMAQQGWADAMTIAEHWRAADEPQTALAWSHRGAEQLKARGLFDEARRVWRHVADESLDAAQALRAQLELAACDMFEDLARGEAALIAVQAQLGAVADVEQHHQIEGRLRSALVDNRVFAGDLDAAALHAARLRMLLPGLPERDRIDALEVLIELAMRAPDIPGAWALLASLRQVAPKRPTLLSFEGQIHWFGGQVKAAHDALARLLERHPDYCRGITVENDLAVMLHAMGDLSHAEVMARRSLQSWAGVAHTETLSLLVLGSVLTSAGRHAEADAALGQALELAQSQSSPGFEAEARVRHARLLLQCGDAAGAARKLALAAPLLRGSPEPLRVSQWVLVSVMADIAQGKSPAADDLRRMRDVAARSSHPLVHARQARVDVELAFAAGDAAAALAAAERQATAARAGGLQEWLVEAWLLAARARELAGEEPGLLRPMVKQAQELATAQGMVALRERADGWLADRA